MKNDRLSIAGPAGNLEALHSGADEGPVAVLCHAHPLYGGSMHDTVLDILARALGAQGITSLRFNFRGVGGSDGAHDGGSGEVDDLRAVLAWLETQHPDRPRLLGGYSFGAGVASRLLADPESTAVERVLLVAPPVGRLPVTAPDGRIPVDVFAGDADPFVDMERLSTWTAARIHVLTGADHFFAGVWQALEDAITDSLVDT